MRFARRSDWNGDPAYRLEGAFFYTLRRLIWWRVDLAVRRGSPLHRLYARWARDRGDT